MDIIDRTRIKSCYDNSIYGEYFMESLSVWYFMHDLAVSEIVQCEHRTSEISGTNRPAVSFFVFVLHAFYSA